VTAESPTSTARDRTAYAAYSLAWLVKDDHPAEAEPLFRQALTLREGLAAEFPDNADYHAAQTACLYSLGQLCRRTGRLPEAERYLQRAVGEGRGLVNEFPASVIYPERYAIAVGDLGLVQFDRGRVREALDSCRRAVILWEELAGRFPRKALYRDNVVASVCRLPPLLDAAGRPREAAEAFRRALALRRALGAEFPAVAVYRAKLADLLERRGATHLAYDRRAAAEVAYRRAAAVREDLADRFPQDSHPDLALPFSRRAWLLEHDRRRGPADKAFRRVVALRERLLAGAGPRQADSQRALLAVTLGYYGDFLDRSGNTAGAEKVFRRALAELEKLPASFGRDPNPDLSRARRRLGSLLYRTGRQEEAYKIFDQVRAAYRRRAEGSPADLDAQDELAWYLANCPHPKVADPARAVGLARKLVERASHKASYWITLGVARYRAKDWKAAWESLEKAIRLDKGRETTGLLFLAMTHWQLGRKDQARTWHRRALARMKAGEPDEFAAEAAGLLGEAGGGE
jgi:tetratricopeptide (TPR) repeat protein